MKDKDIVKLAHKRFKICEEEERENRQLFEEDLKFANGDSDNGWQWDETLVKSREGKPSLTINKIKKHNRQIINEARQNKPSIRVYPVDDNADEDTAEIFNGIIRHIESNSNADIAYDTASEYAIDAGIGYWRITTDYVNNDSFDQEIYIEPIFNPLSVYLGKETIKNGVLVYPYAFFIKEVSKEDFEEDYPNSDYGKSDWSTSDNGWRTEDTVRLAEYYYIEEKEDIIYADDQGNVIKLSEVQDPMMKNALKSSELKSRKISTPQVKWCLIAGDEILEKKDWLGKYIPIVRIVGSELIIDGNVERKGHTRQMKDAQRMYNYWTSSATEFVALQGKQPYLSPVEAIEGHEKYWEDSNSNSLPYLPYNSVDENGNPIPAPKRQEPPIMAQAYIQGMQIASDEMRETSGQENAALGRNPGDQSGRALDALQSKSDTATFHFTDNKARAIRFTGQILIDLIPKIYDTARIVRILGEDDKEDKAEIDPQQPQAAMKVKDDKTGEIKTIYNPGVGNYDIVVSSGQSYGTKRREAFQAMSEMAARNPQLMQIAGDLIMKAADFPMAEELAERLAKTLPPGLQDKKEGESEIPPEVQQQLQQAEQQAQQSEGMIKALDEVVQKMQAELEDKEIERKKLEIDWYNAETNRAKLAQVGMTPEQIQQLVLQTLQDLANPNNGGENEQTAMQQPGQQESIQQPEANPSQGLPNTEQQQYNPQQPIQ